MPPTAQQVYNDVIRALSPTERLRLATLILNELVQQDSPTIDQSDKLYKMAFAELDDSLSNQSS